MVVLAEFTKSPMVEGICVWNHQHRIALPP